jgi:hypothetical protein
MNMARWVAPAALAVLLLVFSLYLQPDFLVMLADHVWSCF